MKETCRINIQCPICGERLEKKYEASKGRWVTHWSIYCVQKACDISTGEQSTLSDAYEALMSMYFGASSTRKYNRDC